MVALVRDVVTDEPKAVHRTALTVDGQKAEVDGNERLALGPIRRGAVKLTPDESVTMCLGVAEGIETALSLQLIPEFGRSPVWSLINKGGLASLPVLPGIETLWIGVVPFTLPTLETAADAKGAAAAIVRAVADGDLTPNEAAELSKVLDNFIRIVEATDVQARLEALERKASQ